jgi:hypothetical protein
MVVGEDLEPWGPDTPKKLGKNIRDANKDDIY